LKKPSLEKRNVSLEMFEVLPIEYSRMKKVRRIYKAAEIEALFSIPERTISQLEILVIDNWFLAISYLIGFSDRPILPHRPQDESYRNTARDFMT